MNETSKSTGSVSGHSSKAFKYSLALALGASLTVFNTIFVTGFVYPDPSHLPLVYALFSLGICVTLHSAFFLFNEVSLERRNKTLSRRIPRYLEYAYALIVSASLVQVFYMLPQYGSYIDARAADGEKRVAAIVGEARRVLALHCPNGGSYFTVEYCGKLGQIISASDSAHHLKTVVFADEAFLSHTRKVVANGLVFAVEDGSPLVYMVRQYRASLKYGALMPTEDGKNTYAWLMFLMLPLAISLRVLKTSLELFIDLS